MPKQQTAATAAQINTQVKRVIKNIFLAADCVGSLKCQT